MLTKTNLLNSIFLYQRVSMRLVNAWSWGLFFHESYDRCALGYVAGNKPTLVISPLLISINKSKYSEFLL